MVRTSHAWPRHRSTPTRRTVAWLAALGLGVAGLALAVPPASAAADDIRVALPGAMAERTVVAASGTAMLLALGAGEVPDKVTTDNGDTFADLAATFPANARIAHSGNGKVVWEVIDAATTGLTVYDFETGTTSTHEVTGGWVESTDSTTAIYSTDAVPEEAGYYAQDLATGEVRRLAQPTAAGAESAGTTFSTDDGAIALASTTATDPDDLAADGSLELLPLNGEPSPLASPETVPGLVAAELRDDQVVYVTAAEDAFSICFRTLADWTSPACRPFEVPGLDDPRTATADLSLGADWALVTPRWGAGSETNLVVGGAEAPDAPVVVTEPDADRVRIFAVGDSERPLAAVWKGPSGYIGQVGADGEVSKLFDYPTGPAQVMGLRLSADRLAGLDKRPGDGDTYQAWQRKVSDTRIAPESLLTPLATGLGASAGRTLLDDGAKLWLSDRGDDVRTLTRPKYGATAASLTGPYFHGRTVAYDQVTRVDGKVMNNSQVRGLFGSLALRLASASLNRYEVIDVVTGAISRIVVPARLEPQKFVGRGIWGDLVLGWAPVGPGQVPTTIVVNYRTGETWDRVGYPFAIGDGFVAVQLPSGDPANAYDDQLAVWNLATGEDAVIPDLDWWEVATDGTRRLAYNTYSELVVRELHGVGRSAPRVLGTLAPGTLNLITRAREWPLQLDATKPLGAGTLTIRDAGGTAVRTYPVDEAPDGSVRDISWDGRDEAGDDVATGTYSWNLEQSAADGTGQLVAVDGQSPVTGQIEVVRTILGTVSGTTPKLSDTTPKVGQTLRVTTGNWTPAAGLEFAYKWYRYGNPTPVGTGDTYQVVAADLGKKLKVSVTGSVEGWTSTKKTSAYSSTVAKGTLSPKPVPTIDNTVPKVGDVLTVTAGAWGPPGVRLTYRWYRVTSRGTAYFLDQTGETYQVSRAVAGYRLKVKVTGRLTGYTTGWQYSALTTKVLKA